MEEHFFEYHFGEADGGFYVDGDDRADGFAGCTNEEVVLSDGGVVDESVDVAKPLGEVIDEGVEGGIVSAVGRNKNVSIGVFCF